MSNKFRIATASDWRRLREILWKWDPLGVGPPRSEYDCLVPPVLRTLEQGGGHEVVAEVLDRQFQQHFGANIEGGELTRMAVEIVDWFAGPRDAEG